jgi:hypothetical protein
MEMVGMALELRAVLARLERLEPSEDWTFGSRPPRWRGHVRRLTTSQTPADRSRQ